MRKTITGTGGMLLLQTLKDAGVEYLFTNPAPRRPGIFAAIAEDGDNRLVVGKHEGLVAAMADGYHRVSGKVGVVIAHVMGGSHQLAGQLFNAQVAGSSLLVVAGDWASELQDYRGLAPFPGLSQAESMRPITKEARCAYQVHTNPAAISVATIRALREATTPPTGPVLPLDQRGAAPSRRAGGADRRRRPLPDRAAGTGARADRRGDRPAPRRGAVPGADVRRRRLARGRAGRGRAAGRAARGAGVREPADLPELPDAASALLRQLSRRAKTSRRPPGSRPT